VYEASADHFDKMTRPVLCIGASAEKASRGFSSLYAMTGASLLLGGNRHLSYADSRLEMITWSGGHAKQEESEFNLD
jgi:hypothetical protein